MPTPRYNLPLGAPDDAVLRLDLVAFGAWSPNLDAIVQSSRTFAYHGGAAADGTIIAGDTIVIPDGNTYFVQRDKDGNVTADLALDFPDKIPIARVTTSGGEITNFEDMRDIQFSQLAEWAGIGGGALTILDVLDHLEDRPSVPSPYNDEFDGASLDTMLWDDSGTTGTYVVRRSKLHCLTDQVTIEQDISGDSLTNPLRIIGEFEGTGLSANHNATIILYGATNGIAVRHGSTDGAAFTRRVQAARYNNLGAGGAFSTSLANTDVSSTVGAVANMEIGKFVMMLLVDGTNVEVWVGPTKDSLVRFFQYARTNVGALEAIRVVLRNGMACHWFRVDQHTVSFGAHPDWVP